MKKFFSSVHFTFNAPECNNSFMLQNKNVLQDLNSQEKFLCKYKMQLLWERVVCNMTRNQHNKIK